LAVHDFTSQRLLIEVPMGADVEITLEREQANYLLNVLRLGEGDEILVFNGRDGEWRAVLTHAGRRSGTLRLTEQTRSQTPAYGLTYMFAPLKRSRLDYMVQKAVELGVGHLRPVLTRRTIAERVNLERMRANAIEAAEQCGVLSLPQLSEPTKLLNALEKWPAGMPLIFCDEEAELSNPLEVLRGVAETSGSGIGVLVGPEGGFAPEERDRLRAMPQTCAISLGPRIMRADTAAVAALALVNVTLGDWR